MFKLGSLGQGYYVDGPSGVRAEAADEEIDIDDEEEKEDGMEGIEQKKVRHHDEHHDEIKKSGHNSQRRTAPSVYGRCPPVCSARWARALARWSDSSGGGPMREAT